MRKLLLAALLLFPVGVHAQLQVRPPVALNSVKTPTSRGARCF